ncbi:MAG TPA: hypothetical protein VE987_03365, partial [Polyangiaceae bacterium]|nr:hypothetical protein [Polyangiaceae bacterium]
MKKQSVLLGLSFLSAVAVALQGGGCLSSPAGPDAGSSSSGGSGGGGSSGGTPSGDGSNCPVTVDPAAVIDDMSGNNGNMNATGGYWYTYSDRTLPNSEPPILITDAGTMNPLEGTAFP